MAKWDIGRFFNTISYFEAIPVFSNVKRLLIDGSIDKSTTSGGQTLGIILVVGAMGEIGQLVISQLLKIGYHVRGTVSDLTLVPFNSPDHLEFVQIDLDGDQILCSSAMQNIQAVIICHDSQQELSLAAIDNLATAVQSYLPSPNELQLFDFTQPNTNFASIWGAVDDVVMGGVSKSGIKLIDGCALFSGEVSTENSGGFASVRTRNFEPKINLSHYSKIQLRVRGDGQRYKLFVRTEPTWDGIGYAYSFDTVAHEWTTIEIPFRDLVPVFRAKTVENAPQIDLTNICSLQLMLSKFEYDRQLNPHFIPGVFALEIESIFADGGKTMPQLIVAAPAPVSPDLIPTLDRTKIPYSIITAGNLDPQSIALICIKSLTQPEAVGQILGR